MGYRLHYEFKHLGDTGSSGFDGTWHGEFNDFIEEPGKTILQFGLDNSPTNVDNQLNSIGFERGVGTRLTIFDALNMYVRHWIVDHPQASINTMLVRITDTLCNKSWGVWKVSADNVEWCDGDTCKLEVSLVQYIPELNCLQNVLISDNHREWFPKDGVPGGKIDPTTGLPNATWIHPRFRYCDDIKPQLLQNFLAALAQAVVGAVFSFVAPILAIASLLQDLINAVFGSGTVDFADDLETELSEVFADITQNFIGCNKLHPAPLVRNYFINACSRCGVEFSSSIFNDFSIDNPIRALYNTVMLYAPVAKGVDDSETTKDWIYANRPIFTAPMLAYAMKDIFNAKYKLEDRVFYFDRRDKFPEEIVFDFTDPEDFALISGHICYNIDNKQKTPISREVKFANDEHDQSGNEALHRYNDIYNWFTENNPTVSVDPLVDPNVAKYEGNEVLQIPEFSVARFANDGVDRKLVLSVSGGIFSELTEWVDGTLLLSSDFTGKAKLIVWDGFNPPDEDPEAHKPVKAEFALDDYVVPDDWTSDWIVQSPGATGYYCYNYPMFFDHTNALGSTLASNGGRWNLFNMHEIDRPTTGDLKNLFFKVTLELCCATLERIVYDDTEGDGIQAKLDRLIQLNDTDKGVIDYVSIDYANFEIILSGRVKYAV